MKVFVYYNLHKKVWSVKDVKTGLVVDHRDFVILKDPVFKVSAAGRARVLREKRKNVHAGVVGELVGSVAMGPDMGPWRGVTYNPYKYDSFVERATEKPILAAEWAIMNASGKPVVVAA